MKKSLKIGIFLPTLGRLYGGSESVGMMKSKYLSRLGHDVYLITSHGPKPLSDYLSFKKENPSIHYIDIVSSFDINRKYLSHKEIHQLYWSLGREISELCNVNKFDLLYSHYTPTNVSIPSSIPLLQTLQGVDTKLWYEDEVAVRLADTLTADSTSIAEGWKSIYSLQDEIVVVRNGVDTETFYPLSTKKEIDILYIGRMIETKGIQYLIMAIDELINKRKFTELKVLLVGDGDYKEELLKMTDKLRLSGYLKFQKEVSESEKNKLYNQSKICVFPSYAKEGVLTTMLEAASAGCAVITSKCCGMLDFIRDGENGLFFNPRNYVDLSNKIEYLLINDVLSKQIGEKARLDVEKEWTWDKKILEFEECIYKAIKNAKNKNIIRE